jgi:hypothetical protein
MPPEVLPPDVEDVIPELVPELVPELAPEPDPELAPELAPGCPGPVSLPELFAHPPAIRQQTLTVA